MPSSRPADLDGTAHVGLHRRPETELRKQISLFLPLSDWRRLRDHAARQGLPITQLVQEWIAPHLEQLARLSD